MYEILCIVVATLPFSTWRGTGPAFSRRTPCRHGADSAGAASSRAELLLLSPAPLPLPLFFFMRGQCQESSPSHICSGSWDGGLHRWGLRENFLALRAAVGWTSGFSLLGCPGLLCIALGILPRLVHATSDTHSPRAWGGRATLAGSIGNIY